MPDTVSIKLIPLGTTLEVEPGAALEAILAPYGIEFPCGGAGTCRSCRVRLLNGQLEITPEMREAFTAGELAEGWRLACRSRVEGPLTLEVAQWTGPVLTDESRVEVEPAEGYAIAIDLGSTTIAAQMLDLATGKILAVRTALNPQTAHGADVMSRIQFALTGSAATLRDSVRGALADLIASMPGLESVRSVLIAGNTVMHHLFSGVDVSPLAAAPFETPGGGEKVFAPAELGWPLPETATVRFLPCLGSFVGSDVLAGMLATGLGTRTGIKALIDLGTNGEIAVGDSAGILCASTAAGPAFEAGRIRMGMRAAPGAISHVAVQNGGIACRVFGNGAPRGVCGSGLVDAAAAALRLGAMGSRGRLMAPEFALAGPVALTQADFRELQLAKAAVAAGLRILSARFGASAADLQELHLAGAFGNYVNTESARRIGLLETRAEAIIPAGNTSLRGLKMALLAPARCEPVLTRLRSITRHVPLAGDAAFQETFADCLMYPDAEPEPAPSHSRPA